eukprot:TRINITY_DN1610_c0_g2_i1.p1 TRINITY_DN1610_c0_g2~~TRINITY_DN1610_c0_g2_i1.p1  ORF type:complete len:471 (-),score=223.37 TRINITY_DN1610_c0_g2_i1:530-1942(-)
MSMKRGKVEEMRRRNGDELEALRAQHIECLNAVGGVHVDAFPLFECCPYGVRFEMPVLVQLRAGPLEDEGARLPLELCVVLDRSGSMRQVMGRCKEAVEEVMQRMGPEDVLHLVAYDNEVEVVFEGMRAHHHEEMRARLKGLQVRGSTDLMAGVERGMALLGASTASAAKTKAMFLFSDGLANAGVRDPEAIGRRTKELSEAAGAAVSAFGIGSRYDARLMGSIARAGGGAYVYLDEEERIPLLVRRGVDGITRLWSPSASLTAQGRPSSGTCVTSVSNTADPLRPKRFAVREFAFHQYLVRAESTAEAPTDTPLAVEIDFECTLVGRSEPVRQRIVVSAPRVDSATFAGCTPHPQVDAYLKSLELSEQNKEVLRLIAERASSDRVLSLKRSIVKGYEALAEEDPHVVWRPLLLRERELLAELEASGVHSEAARKKADYVASKAAGYAVEQYDYCAEDDEDDDMGFALFT